MAGDMRPGRNPMGAKERAEKRNRSQVIRRRNTSEQGNAFRDKVRRLLEITPGCTSVCIERRIGTQAVDLYYEERTSFGKLRVVCECKDRSQPLTRDFIARQIFPRYSPLLSSGQVDAVRIIASRDLGAEAEAYVRECGFAFQTIDQLESGIIDFRRYLRSLISAFSEDGLDRYYVRPLLDTGEDLETLIEGWLSGPSSQPIALLAGYGMGKTSFARRLAFVLAQRALENPGSRIPILIPLAEISAEQTLEGLLGKLLDARYHIPGYHFSPFAELNRRGRFVIILDGFDEMKHAISWTEFQRNFAELHRLTGERTRVLLLGRPSALLSEEQESFVLRGQYHAGSQVYSVAGAPEYRLLRLRGLSDERALEFIRNYATYRSAEQAATQGRQVARAEVAARIESIKADPEMMGLIGRPVQAKMLADLAIDPRVKWRSFSRYELYREFIERIGTREANKPTRALFDGRARLSSIRRVAWWVWTGPGTHGFSLADLPESVHGPVPDKVGASVEGIRRDLVSGSILEKKTGDIYYFPHRSFLEFLVAEYVCIEADPEEVVRYSGCLTAEVLDFIKESGRIQKVAAWSESVYVTDVTCAPEFIALIAWAMTRCDKKSPAALHAQRPWDVLFDYYRMAVGNSSLDVIAAQLLAAFNRARVKNTRITCLRLLLVVFKSAASPLQETLGNNIVSALLWRSQSVLRQLMAADPPRRYAHSFMAQALVDAVWPSGQSDEAGLVVSVDWTAMDQSLEQSLSGPWYLFEHPYAGSRSEFRTDVVLSERSMLGSRRQQTKPEAVLEAFLRQFPDPLSRPDMEWLASNRAGQVGQQMLFQPSRRHLESRVGKVVKIRRWR